MPRMRRSPLLALSFFACLLAACGDGATTGEQTSSTQASVAASAIPPQPDWSAYSGALIQVGMASKVGVLLDELEPADRARLVALLEKKPTSFWQDRAARQIKLTTLRLHFRNKGDGTQLPLPPEEQWEISIPNPPRRELIDGHDLLTVDYAFSGVLLTDAVSPGQTEPALGRIGGSWTERFTFPVDPELLFQRTGFACMNESQFPPNSMDAEESDLFFDDHCGVEPRLSVTRCHQTELPTRSCVQALAAEVGRTTAMMTFTRLPWSKELADDVRTGVVTNLDGPDLIPVSEEFRKHRFTYRFIPLNSCTIIEKCVGDAGWRKLLMFPTADINAGAKPLDIGDVDYFHEHGGTTLSEHGLFELSACHNHYHFSHYGTFALGDGPDAQSLNRKNGFCMQPTARLANHELSPMRHPYTDCVNQGVAAGWIDEYKMGLECQWLDVTEVTPGQTLPLSFTTNPDGLLCEGTLKRDAAGETLYEPSEFTTSTGEPVDRPQCDFMPGWLANNSDSYDVSIPPLGDSYITQACREGLFGEKRDCGFKNEKLLSNCVPGQKVTLRCALPAGGSPQVVRICEGSRGLQLGIPCTYADSLASVVVAGPADVTFTCPSKRDGVETGGTYSTMTALLLPGDARAAAGCVAR
jgi:hypothetical protein